MVNLSILNDLIIKFLLGEPGKSEDALKNFLNAIRKQTNQSRIESVRIQARDNIPARQGNKLTFLDIKAMDENGRQYNVEVQLANQPWFINRLLYYWSTLYSSQLQEGEEYDKLCPTITIVLTRFELFPKYPGIFHPFHIIHDRHPELTLTNDFQMYFIQLTDKITLDDLSSLCEDLVGWIYFLNYPHTSESKMKTVLFENPTIGATSRKLARFLARDPEREALEAREKSARELYAIERGGFLKGREEGIEIGREEGIEIGPEKGIKLGEERGVLIGQANMVLQLLARTLSEPIEPELKQRLIEWGDSEKLSALLIKTITVKSMEEFKSWIE